MIGILKRIAARLPNRYQQELKRLHFAHQIRKRTFRSNEHEFSLLESWVGEGDWVLDIGANVGHYAGRLSQIVGQTGRVIAFEPVPQTFELLAGNIARLPLNNVTLLNIAVSESIKVLGVKIPLFDTGLDNYYEAYLTNDTTELQVLCLPIDCLNIPETIKLAKIDVEGHELSVLKGMEKLLERDHPILIVEGISNDVAFYLKGFGYSAEKIEDSPDTIFKRQEADI